MFAGGLHRHRTHGFGQQLALGGRFDGLAVLGIGAGHRNLEAQGAVLAGQLRIDLAVGHGEGVVIAVRTFALEEVGPGLGRVFGFQAHAGVLLLAGSTLEECVDLGIVLIEFDLLERDFGVPLAGCKVCLGSGFRLFLAARIAAAAATGKRNDTRGAGARHRDT